jgi:hypothetical protein
MIWPSQKVMAKKPPTRKRGPALQHDGDRDLTAAIARNGDATEG